MIKTESARPSISFDQRPYIEATEVDATLIVEGRQRPALERKVSVMDMNVPEPVTVQKLVNNFLGRQPCNPRAEDVTATTV
jgi:hypothetical protein